MNNKPLTNNNTSLPFLSHLLLTLLPNIATSRFWSLVEAFGSPERVLLSPPAELPFLNEQGRSLLRDYQHQGEHSQLMQSAQHIIHHTDKQQGKIIHSDHHLYPPLLKEIHQPPPILYTKGDLHNLSLPQLALVGSRNPTHNGLQNTRLFASHLAKCGFTITSGLALGIDGAAHQATLNAHGKTIAVMATGIDDIYPKRHRYLADQILAAGGTLITEFPPQSPPKADHFPRRNRIISGLSLGVLIVEAAIKSGSLITANYALEQGREVFAIPSSIHNPQAKGCHQLIKRRATLVENSEDIVEHLQGILHHLRLPARGSALTTEKLKNKVPESLSAEETLIIHHLGFKPTTIDQLSLSTRLSPQQLSVHLINLEIHGWIKLSDWGYECV
ncbi:DNA protecting protein DprA [Candidatus Endobugula sertula]|uniref:DNA protecting protein DprA n=1 Tax=Candidatus Endobugula sertula TaxID=62101 RepID=A0A1D2QNL5_9GAMM|nr:DNA protecting protein DprA [Candidatus Endobugula sertula]